MYNKIKNFLFSHLLMIVTLGVACLLFVWAVGCPPRVASLINPAAKVTRPELLLEFDQLMAQFELKNLELERQEELRNYILKNALLIAQTETFNPIGLLTGLMAIYGVGSAAKSTKNAIKKIKVNGNT